jgi:hypothetical protein
MGARLRGIDSGGKRARVEVLFRLWRNSICLGSGPGIVFHASSRLDNPVHKKFMLPARSRQLFGVAIFTPLPLARFITKSTSMFGSVLTVATFT